MTIKTILTPAVREISVPAPLLLAISLFISIALHERLFGASVENPLAVPAAVRASAERATPQQIGRTKFNGVLLGEAKQVAVGGDPAEVYRLYVTSDLYMLCARTWPTGNDTTTVYRIQSQKWTNYNAQGRFCFADNALAMTLIDGLSAELSESLYVPVRAPGLLSPGPHGYYQPFSVHVGLKLVLIAMLTCFLTALGLLFLMVLHLGLPGRIRAEAS